MTATTKTAPEYLTDCLTIMATDNWQGKNGDDQHEAADGLLNDTVRQIYEYCDPDDVIGALNALDSCPNTTAIKDKLELFDALLVVAEIESATIEIGADELQAAFDSGEATKMDAEQVRKLLGKVTH